MRPTPTLLWLGCIFASAQAFAQSAPVPAPSTARGTLLYDTHCIACHTTEVHWRGRKLVTDWPSLKEQVRRWQAVQQLNWGEEDIVQVSRHLNGLFYKVKETGAVGQSAAIRSAPRPQRVGG